MALIVSDSYKKEKWMVNPAGLAVPVHFETQRLQKADWPIAIDLFAGCGGFSLGMMQAGVHVIAAAEWDTAATITYTYNLGAYPMRFEFVEKADEDRLEEAMQLEIKRRGKGIVQGFVAGGGWRKHYPDTPGCEVFFFGDIRNLTGERILKAIGKERGEVDIVCGGPPCQGFSRAGRRNVMDPRNSLVFEFARLVLEIAPKTMVMENVPDILNMITPEGIPVVDALCRVLEDGGFQGFDALKKSLTISAGVGGAMRGTGAAKTSRSARRRAARKEAKTPTPEVGQIAMEL